MAASGAIFSWFFGGDPFSLIRISLSFFVLLLSIRQVTDVREWSTAIGIAIASRIISILVMWLLFAGGMMLFALWS